VTDSTLIAGLVGALLGSGVTWLLASLDRWADIRGAVRALFVEASWNAEALASAASPNASLGAELPLRTDTWDATLVYAGRRLKGTQLVEVATFYETVKTIIERQGSSPDQRDDAFLIFARAEGARMGAEALGALRVGGWLPWHRREVDQLTVHHLVQPTR
jgi:hypothetical protein